jgi:hypothetical protein
VEARPSAIRPAAFIDGRLPSARSHIEVGQGHDTREHIVLIGPSDDAGIGACPDPFRHDIGVEKEVPGSTLRGRLLTRLAFIPDPRSGDAAKNFVRLPVRFVFRSHSSAATMTTDMRGNSRFGGRSRFLRLDMPPARNLTQSPAAFPSTPVCWTNSMIAASRPFITSTNGASGLRLVVAAPCIRIGRPRSNAALGKVSAAPRVVF